MIELFLNTIYAKWKKAKLSKKSNRIRNNKRPKNNVTKGKTPLKKKEEEKLVISMSYKNWIKGYRGKDITTYTETKEEFVNNLMYIIYTLIPYVYENWGQKMSHCHSINELRGNSSKEAQGKYIEVIKNIHPELLNPLSDKSKNKLNGVEYGTGQLEDLELYQLGLKGSVRVICGKVDNTLYPLLIDHHHLGYESQKYNQRDTNKFDFCPINCGLTK
ncbi:hypothetical protein ACKQTC_07025 [Peptococcus simiae]|uniref:Uncharacterized protein n=1 Tax=Peptococcus simiae TaxID=1643805 RepID=A0ABW9H243_9FIRM